MSKSLAEVIEAARHVRECGLRVVAAEDQYRAAIDEQRRALAAFENSMDRLKGAEV